MEAYDLKDSGFDWLGNIPIHWGIDRLKDISHLRDEKTATKSSDENYLELEDLSQWTGKILNKRNTLEVASQVNIFYEGDVLFGKLRPYLAKYAYVDFNGKCTGEILAIKPTRIYGGYLAYYVGSKHFINHCDNFSYGAKMPRINWNTQMGIFPIPIPPVFEEQKAIADYLDKACQNIDKTITLKQQQLDKLEAYRKSVIHEAVTKGLDKTVLMKDSGVEWLGEIPQGWRVKRIKDFGKVIGGYAFKSSDFRQEGALILKISNVSHLSLKWDDISYLPENYEIIYSDYVAPPNSLIFALTRPIIKAGIKTVKLLENESFLINQRIGFFKPSNKVNNSFLIYVTQSSGFVAIFEKKITSSTIQPNISTEKIESIKFFCPPIPEQKAIADYLDKACTNIYKTKETIAKQIKTLTQYRQSLIHECVTGKKRVCQGKN